MTEKITNNIIERPPVIAVMGHIDHGKSRLLDYIRQTNIVERESGGITQHTSAYEVVHNNKKITFLDTPGHEAFEAMRQRGALICDIAILIVSAEEGVKAQTLEALNSIKENNKPFVVAINKIDRPNADPDKTKQSLAENGIFVEGYGGNIPCALISSTEGTGVEDLMDLLLLVAELEELKGDTSKPAEGYILESNLDSRTGITATLVIKDGILTDKDYIVVGKEITKVKKIENFLGESKKDLTFSSPAKIYGFSSIPSVGNQFKTFNDKCEAEKYAGTIKAEGSDCLKLDQSGREEDAVSIPIVIKADVAGTLQAVEREICKAQVEKVYTDIISKNVGPVTENDVKSLVAFPGAVIIAFKVKVEKSAQALAEKSKVVIQTSDIIYKLSEWLEEEMKKRAPKITIEETLGRAKILKIFGHDKDRQILGGIVSSGKLIKNKPVKILRRDIEIGRGKITNLQLQKIKVDEVDENNQFGAEIDSVMEISEGDIIEAFDTIIK